MANGFLAFLARATPEPIVRAVGRRDHSRGLFRIIDSVARSALSGDVAIARGPAAGMRFNAGGGRAGFALGTWEPDAQAALADLIDEGDVVYDVGAAIGFYTLIAASQAGPSGKVIAFEPLQDSLRQLRGNIEINDLRQVQVFELALSSSSGRETLIEGTNEDQAVLASMPRGQTQHGREVEVEVATIDELVANGTIPLPNVIKMDIEGAEIEALQGARTTLAASHPTLMVEVHDRWDEFDAIMRDTGYVWEAVEQNEAVAHAIARPAPVAAVGP